MKPHLLPPLFIFWGCSTSTKVAESVFFLTMNNKRIKKNLAYRVVGDLLLYHNSRNIIVICEIRLECIRLDMIYMIVCNVLGCFIVPKVFIFTSIVIFPISYVPQVNLNQKYWIKIEIYYPARPIKVLYYEVLRGKKDDQILLKKSMKELNYWPQWVKLCLLGPPRLPKKIWGLWANILYVAQGAYIWGLLS